MLRNGSHVRKEHFDIIAVVAFAVLLRDAAQRLVALTPAVRFNCRDLFGCLARLQSLAKLRNRRTGLRRLDSRFRFLTLARILQCCKAFLLERFVHISEIGFDILLALFQKFRHILCARIKKLLCHIRIHVISDDAILAQFEALEPRFERLADFLLHVAGFESLDDTALALNRLEFCPNLFLNFFRQRLDCPRAACRIDRLHETEFFLQHDLHIARDAARELIALANRFIERSVLKGVKSADDTGEDLRRVAQHVDVRIVNRLEKQCGTCMYMDALRLFSTAERLDDLRPNRANRTKLRNLQEEVRAHREAEHHLPCRLVDRKPAFHEGTQVSDTDGERRGDFLHIVGAAARNGIAAHHDRLEIRRILFRPESGLRHLIVELGQRSVVLATLNQLAQGICSHEAANLREITAVRLDGRSDERQHRQGRRARIDVERMLVELQAVERRVHILDRRNIAAFITDFFSVLGILVEERRRIEADVVDRRSLLHFTVQEFVVFLGQRLIARLRDAPGLFDIAVRTHTAQEVVHAREVRPRQDLVRHLVRVHRLEGDALVRFREHLFLEGRPLQEFDACLFPLVIRRRFKFVERHIGETRLLFGLLQDGLQVKILVLTLCLIAHISTASLEIIRNTTKSRPAVEGGFVIFVNRLAGNLFCTSCPCKVHFPIKNPVQICAGEPAVK